MLRTSNDVTKVATELSEFLMSNSAQDASVCMFSGDEDLDTLYGDDGLMATSMRSAS